MLMLASLAFGDALLTVLERSPDLSGWGKVGWLLADCDPSARRCADLPDCPRS